MPVCCCCKKLKSMYFMSLLHLHRQTENGLVEAVAVLISKMPRMRLEHAGNLGECFKSKPDFVKVSLIFLVMFFSHLDS